LKEKALDRTLRRIRFGKGYGLIVRLGGGGGGGGDDDDDDVTLYPSYIDLENLEGRWSKFFPVLLVKKEKDML